MAWHAANDLPKCISPYTPWKKLASSVSALTYN